MVAPFRHHGHVVKTDGAVRVTIEEINLLLQLERVGPVVVAFHRAMYCPRHAFKVATKLAHHPQVAFGQEQADSLRVAFPIVAHNGTRAIGRAVFADDELNREVGLLHEHALDGLRDERSWL